MYLFSSLKNKKKKSEVKSVVVTSKTQQMKQHRLESLDQIRDLFLPLCTKTLDPDGGR